jgi:hypothetical protein
MSKRGLISVDDGWVLPLQRQFSDDHDEDPAALEEFVDLHARRWSWLEFEPHGVIQSR